MGAGRHGVTGSVQLPHRHLQDRLHQTARLRVQLRLLFRARLRAHLRARLQARLQARARARLPAGLQAKKLEALVRKRCRNKERGGRRTRTSSVS